MIKKFMPMVLWPLLVLSALPSRDNLLFQYINWLKFRSVRLNMHSRVFQLKKVQIAGTEDKDNGSFWLQCQQNIPFNYFSNVNIKKVITILKDLKQESKNCAIYRVEDNRHNDKNIQLFTENFFFKKDRIRILFLGGSTIVDNMGPYPFPYIYQLFLEAKFPGKYEIINMGTWGANLLQHIYDWGEIQEPNSINPIFINHSFPRVLDKEFSYSQLQSILFGLKNLQADVIVIGSMWNDFSISLMMEDYHRRYESGQKFIKGINAKIDVGLAKIMEETYNYQENTKKFLEVTNSMVLPLESKLEGEEGLKNDFIQYYQHLLKIMIELIKREHPQTKITLLSLPYALGNETSATITKILTKELNTGSYNTNYSVNETLEYYQWIDRVQVSAMKSLAERENLEFFNISNIYHQSIQIKNIHDYRSKDLFYPDLYHFTRKGNHYLAEVLSKLMTPFLEANYK